MDVDWIQTFLVAAEEENFHRTAQRLHLAQPTVTQQIRKLEEAWGVALFVRVGRGLRLSPAGLRFRQHAEHLWLSYQKSREDMIRWAQGYEEVIEIAVSPLVATTYLPQWIRGFSKLHPNVEFSVNVKESAEVAQGVLSGQFNIGFSRGTALGIGMHVSRLYEDPVLFVAPTDTQDNEGVALRSALEILQTQTLLTGSHPDYWEDLMIELRRVFPALKTMHVNLVHVTIHFIVEKMGVSFLPESTVRRELLRGTMEEIPFPYFKLPTAYTYQLIGEGLTDLQKEFVRYVEEYMRVRVRKL